MEIIIRDGNIEDGISQFRRLVGRSGVHPAVRFRELYPGLGDRRKEKARRAATRKRKREARRAQYA